MITGFLQKLPQSGYCTGTVKVKVLPLQGWEFKCIDPASLEMVSFTM